MGAPEPIDGKNGCFRGAKTRTVLARTRPACDETFARLHANPFLHPSRGTPEVSQEPELQRNLCVGAMESQNYCGNSRTRSSVGFRATVALDVAPWIVYIGLAREICDHESVLS